MSESESKKAVSLSPTTMVMMGLLVVAAFFIGNMYTKLQMLEKGGSAKGGGAVAADTGVVADEAVVNLEDKMYAAAEDLGIDADAFKTCVDSGKYTDRVNNDMVGGQDAGITGTPGTIVVSKGGAELISGALPFASVKQVIDNHLAGNPVIAADVKIASYPPLTDLDHVKGDKNAPIVLIEYSDYECPFCHRFQPAITQVMEEYGDKVALVYRHFPLSFHPYAQPLAEGSECIAELGGNDAFWEFTDAIFTN